MPAYQFGTPVLPLYQVIDELDIAQGNTTHARSMANFVHAKWMYKELYWKTLWGVVQKVVPVENVHPELCDNDDLSQPCSISWTVVRGSEPPPTALTQKEHSGIIKLPLDMVRLINISVMDKCGNQQPLGFNPYINTVDMSCGPAKCSCRNCGGNDSYCSILDAIQMVAENIVINNVTYIKKTWIRKDERGNLLQVSSTPVYDPNSDSVTYIETKEILCQLDVDQQGCIKYTEPNRTRLLTYCGCYVPMLQRILFQNQCETGLSKMTSNYGEWNWDAKAGDVIHLKHIRADRVIIAYQPSGESPETEILVPEYAVDAMLAGISYRQKWISPAYSIAEKTMSEKDWLKSRNKLWDFMNPIRMDELINIASLIPKWKTTYDERRTEWGGNPWLW